MKGDSKSRRHDKPAMIIAVIALVIALTGTAYAALAHNSVGSRQIKAKAVTTAKLASGAVDQTKVADHTLTGSDFNMAEFGRVPKATEAGHAAAATRLNDASTAPGETSNPAACPANTRLIHGVCFDATSSGPVEGVKTAADACAAKGGFLPTLEELASTRATLNLGVGGENSTHNMFTDSYFADPEHKEAYGTMVVSESGSLVVVAQEYESPKNSHKFLPPATEEYFCVYPLIR